MYYYTFSSTQIMQIYDRLLKIYKTVEYSDRTTLQHLYIKDKSEIAVIDVPTRRDATRRGLTLYLTFLDFAHFPMPTRFAFHFSRLRHQCPAQNQNPSKRGQGKNLARESPLTAFTHAIALARVCSLGVSLCRCVQMRRRLHSCSCTGIL